MRRLCGQRAGRRAASLHTRESTVPFRLQTADCRRGSTDSNSQNRRSLLYTMHYKLYTIHYTLYTIHYTLYTATLLYRLSFSCSRVLDYIYGSSLAACFRNFSQRSAQKGQNAPSTEKRSAKHSESTGENPPHKKVSLFRGI